VAAVERLYSNSASLHGDAVVSFMRALCAVSQEELHPTGGQGGERPRVGLLQRVVECAYHNMGRIRLVWARLWTLVAQHLVSAACHTGGLMVWVGG
jgi:Sec7-like guanine-nucleotide exchange factor